MLPELAGDGGRSILRSPCAIAAVHDHSDGGLTRRYRQAPGIHEELAQVTIEVEHAATNAVARVHEIV